MTNLPPLAPGTYVTSVAAQPNPGANAPTGTWFVTGECAQGPTGVAIPIASMLDFVSFLGSRQSYGTALYDSLDEFFHDGGQLAYVSRVVGPSAVSASVILKDQSGAGGLNTLTITANGPGAWGNSLSVVVATGTVTNTYTLTIEQSGTIIASSPNLYSPADAVAWATTLSPWTFPVTIANDGSASSAPTNNPTNGTFSLASGADDLADITETQWTAALTAFGKTLGPGQVSAPGHTTTAGWQALVAHASANNRFALLDDVDSASASAIVANVASAQSGAAAGATAYAVMLAPWVQIPGLPAVVGGSPTAATRTIPPCALVAAVMARNDQTNDCNLAAAGANGQSGYALGVTQSYVDADRATLDQAGVDVIRVIGGVVTVYGNRTISTDPAWVVGSHQRMRMQLAYEGWVIGQGFVFAEIDGQGHTLAGFQGALLGNLQQHANNGSLWSYAVDVGAPVNTPATFAQGQLNAIESVQFSPNASVVQIEIVSYPVTQQIPS